MKTKRWIFIIAGLVIGAVIINVSYSKQAAQDVIVTDVKQVAEESGNIPEKVTLFVDVKGAVARPGVYEFNEGDRVLDIVDKAGGLTEEADEMKVNLAEILQDEMVVYIPIKDEKIGQEQDTSLQFDGKIRVNEASKQDLESLTGIGPAKAAAIIQYRTENGRFKKIEDLLEVPGIGPSSLERLRPEITIY